MNASCKFGTHPLGKSVGGMGQNPHLLRIQNFAIQKFVICSYKCFIDPLYFFKMPTFSKLPMSNGHYFRNNIIHIQMNPVGRSIV